MPAESALTELGREMIDALPVRLRYDPDIRAVQHVHARECERMEHIRQRLLANLSPRTADLSTMRWWEWLLEVTGHDDEALETRQRRAWAALLGLHAAGTGAWWERVLTRAFGPHWFYREYRPDGQPVPVGQLTNLWRDPSATQAARFAANNSTGITVDAGPVVSTAWKSHGAGSMRYQATNPGATSRTISMRTADVSGTRFAIVPGKRYLVRSVAHVTQTRSGYIRQRLLTATAAGGAAVQTLTGPVFAVSPDELVLLSEFLPTDVTGVEASLGWLDTNAAGAASLAVAGTYEVFVDEITVVQSDTMALEELGLIYGGTPGSAWLGAADDSQSVSPVTPSNPAPNTIIVSLPFDPGSPRYAWAQRVVRRFTDSHIDLVFEPTLGLKLDNDQLDQDRVR